MARCLVVGANGFLGSYLVDELLSLGHEVTAFDRFSSGQTNFAASDIRLHPGEFLNRADLEAAVQAQDYVFHFLSTTSPATAQDDPSLDVRTNISQTIELLDLCVSAGIKKFFYASSGGAIYGNQSQQEFSELDATLPVSPYGIGKLAVERYLSYYRAQHGLDSVAFRISNPYGSRQHAHRRQGFIPIALSRIATGTPVQRFGDGRMTRDYVYAPDVVRMIGRTVGAETEYDVYNIGSGIGHTVNEVLELLAEVTGNEVAIEHVPMPPTFVERVVLNTERFQREFPLSPPTPIRLGIERTWETLTAVPDALPAA